MKITLCVDKQDRGNPSEELKRYLIDIGCPLRSANEKFDELKIQTNDNNQLVGEIIRRCYVDKYGVLRTLDTEETQVLDIPAIELFEGTNYVYILEYTNLNMKVEYLTNAEMNKYFATKMEMNSTIQQTYDSIMLKVSEKADSTEVSAMIKMLSDEIALRVIKGGVVNELNISDELIKIIGNRLKIDTTNFKLSEDGTCTANKFSSKDAEITGGKIKINSHHLDPKIIIGTDENNDKNTLISEGRITLDNSTNTNGSIVIDNISSYENNDIVPTIWLTEKNSNVNYTAINTRSIDTPVLYQHSLSKMKKNFKKCGNVLNLILNSDIYEYNLKNEKDTDKKHIGLVIGDGYRCANEVINQNRTGIDQYSMISVAWQSIREIVEKYDSKIKKLEERIKELEVK